MQQAFVRNDQIINKECGECQNEPLTYLNGCDPVKSDVEKCVQREPDNIQTQKVKVETDYTLPFPVLVNLKSDKNELFSLFNQTKNILEFRSATLYSLPTRRNLTWERNQLENSCGAVTLSKPLIQNYDQITLQHFNFIADFYLSLRN